jgi:hypothetical protein
MNERIDIGEVLCKALSTEAISKAPKEKKAAVSRNDNSRDCEHDRRKKEL